MNMALKGSIKHHLLWHFLQAMDAKEKRKCKTPTKLLFANTERSQFINFLFSWPLGGIVIKTFFIYAILPDTISS